MTESPAASLVLIVGYEGSEPAQRALAAAGRILGNREGWIEIVYVAPHREQKEESSEPPADVIDSLGPEHPEFHYTIRSLLDTENQRWHLRSASGAVAERLLETARQLADEGGGTRTVVLVVGSDRRQTFSVPNDLARRSTVPVVIVP